MIYKRLEKLRVLRGLNKAELCRQIKMAPTTYSGYAFGKREPDLQTIDMFSKFYGVSVDYLINGDEKDTYNEETQEIVDLILSLSNEDQKVLKDLANRMKKSSR